MRSKIQIQQAFDLTGFMGNRNFEVEFESKYRKLNDLLDSNPILLINFHQEIKNSEIKSVRSCKYPSEVFFRLFIVQFIEALSYRKLSLRVSDSFILRRFCKIGIGDVPEPSMISRIRTQLSPQLWKSLNTLLVKQCASSNIITNEELRVDTTVTETNVHYPTESTLLLDCYRYMNRSVSKYNKFVKPESKLSMRFHKDKIKLLCISISRTAKSIKGKEKIIDYYKVLISRVSEAAYKIKEYCINGSISVHSELFDSAEIALEICKQAESRIVHHNKINNESKILSIHERHSRLIKRGKAGKMFEIGHKVGIMQSKERFIVSYTIDNETKQDSNHLTVMLNEIDEIFVNPPMSLATDKGFWQGQSEYDTLNKTIDNLAIPKKGKRDKIEEIRETSDKFKLAQKFRAGIEGSIGVLKNCYKMARCLWRGFNGYQSWIGCSVLSHNLVLLTKL